MGSAFHLLCSRYSGTPSPTVPTAIRLWETFTLYILFGNFYVFFLFQNHQTWHLSDSIPVALKDISYDTEEIMQAQDFKLKCQTFISHLNTWSNRCVWL